MAYTVHKVGQLTCPVLVMLAKDKTTESVVGTMKHTDKFPSST